MNIRLIALVLAAALAGCASNGTRSSAPAADSSAASSSATPAAPARPAGNRQCNAEPVQSVIGQSFTSSVADATRQRAGATTLRVLRPNELMTMEYNPFRLTVVVDEQNAVTSVRCG